MELLITLFFWLLAITVAITVHEFAHAYVADRLGDPTARYLGRISLNPIRHYDQVGTTMLIITSVMRAFGAPVIPFGWAKPVPFDPYNLRHPRRDSALIALAGPVSNLILAVLLSLLFRLPVFNPVLAVIQLIAYPIVTLNVALAIFNLIPVHPLDGGKIIAGLLPRDLAIEFDQILHRYGMLILLFLIFPINGVSPISSLISPAISFLLNLLIP